MTITKKNRIWIPSVCLAVLGVVGPPALAQNNHFKIYGGPAYVAPMSDSDVTLGTTRDTLETEKRVGWNLGIEGRFTKWIGVEIDYVNATQDVNFGGTKIGETNFSPLTATFDIHVVHTKVVDFYLGPSYSYVNWGDIKVNDNGRNLPGIDVNSEFGSDSAHGWGAGLGLDIGVAKHVAISGGVKYLNVNLERSNGSSADVKPLVARLGIAFRF